jgi:hypothetical protein
MRHRILLIAAIGVGLVAQASVTRAGSDNPPPYSCRQLYDEQKKCGFGSCDKRVIDRLTRECLRDGGRP